MARSWAERNFPALVLWLAILAGVLLVKRVQAQQGG